MQQRLAPVAVRIDVHAVEDFVDLEPEQRNVSRTLAVGSGREQPDEAVLADHFALVVVEFDADVVKIGRPVDRGTRVGLRDDQPVLRVSQAAHLAR